MMFGKLVELPFANLCCLSASPGHTETFKNTGSGGFTQFTYTVSGAGEASNDAGLTASLSAGQLTDMGHLHGAPFTGVAGPSGAMWISINPKPEGLLFDAAVIKHGDTDEVVGGPLEKIILTLSGTLRVAGTAIGEHRFARVSEGQSFTVTADPASVGVVLTRRAA